ncbi:hypothetical protein BDV93DRAFT_611420 [Ceratobasidium sp. AG-I]|nr:hypothetical protein BDV93DRAFT_611420 [Ceratobasidium sp. AG-I]
MRATKSAQEMSKHAVETAKGGGVFDVRGNAQSHAPRQPQIQTQQVVVAFTGNPQVDAQACLASFLAQYPGIQPVPMWGAGKGDDASAMAGESEMTVMDQLATSNGTHGGMAAGAGTIHRMHSTPELTRSGSRGLEHLLTAARTVLRARSRSTTPTPRRQLHSASLSSPYRLAQQNHSPPSPKSRQVASARRRHSSPVVQPGDSDTEPEETPKSRQRVYSALDVLADQAAAVRTSSPDPPMDVFTSSQNLFERTTEPAASVPVSPTLLSPPQPVTNASLSEPSTSLDVMSSEKPLLDSLSSSSLKRPRVPSEGPFGGGQLAVPGTTTGAEAESLDQAGQSIRQHTEGRKGDPVHHQETDSWQIPAKQGCEQWTSRPRLSSSVSTLQITAALLSPTLSPPVLELILSQPRFGLGLGLGAKYILRTPTEFEQALSSWALKLLSL